MEYFACIAGGIALMGCGAGLFLVRAPAWPQDEAPTDKPHDAVTKRSGFQIGVRYLNNFLLIIAGGVIASTPFVPRGRIWMLLWAAILLLLVGCILLALIDALTSLSGYRKALPRAARRSLGSDHEQPS